MVHIFLYIAAIPFNKQPLGTVPRQDPPDQPGWISKIQTSGREVLVHLQLTSSERQQLQLSTGTSGGASSACRARLERLDTGEVWMLPLSAGCSSAKWTRDGLKLTLEDLDESMSRWSIHHGKSANPRRRVKLSIAAPRASWSCWRSQSRIRPDMTRWS